jgi:hypothetical protein
MASPHVAGTAALVWIAYPSWTNADVRDQLQITADDLGATGWDSKYGYGLVDADEAAGVVETPLDTEAPVITGATGNTTGTTGESVTISATITDNVGVANATVYYTPIDGTETTVAMAKEPDPSNIWKANLPVASNKVGTITYYLKAKDAAGNEARDPSAGSYSITVTDNDVPTANAGSDQSVLVNAIVTRDGSGSTDNIGITSYKWDFDASDGVNWNSPNATGVTVTTSYSTPGTYTVTLQASDAAGLTATDTALITVSETPATLTAYVNIDLSKQVVSKWWRVTAIATVTKDTSGPVIADATVEGTWGGVYTGTVSGTTDANGKVSFKTGFIRNTGTVTFKVTKVIKDTQEYTLAGETNKSISN